MLLYVYTIPTTKPVTVNISEELDREFRKYAAKKYGKRKGYLGKAFSEAISDWVRKRESDDVSRSLELLRKGIPMKKWTFSRDELYER